MDVPLENYLTKLSKGKAYRDNAFYFTTGIIDLMFSTWLLTAYTGFFWMFSSIKFFVLAWRQYRRHITSAGGKHIWMLEFCYISNVLFVLYFIFGFIRWKIKALQFTRNWDYYFIRTAYSWSNGPLALSLVQQANGFAFHSLDHMTMLSIHSGPPLTFFGLRYFGTEIDRIFPELFMFDTIHESSIWDSFIGLFFIPCLLYVVGWALPYGIYMSYNDEMSRRAKGYVTIIGDLENNIPAAKILLNICGNRLKTWVYLTTHAFIVFLIFLPSQLLWRVYWVNVAFIVFLVLVAARNAGQIYFQKLIPRLIASFVTSELKPQIPSDARNVAIMVEEDREDLGASHFSGGPVESGNPVGHTVSGACEVERGRPADGNYTASGNRCAAGVDGCAELSFAFPPPQLSSFNGANEVLDTGNSADRSDPEQVYHAMVAPSPTLQSLMMQGIRAKVHPTNTE